MGQRNYQNLLKFIFVFSSLSISTQASIEGRQFLIETESHIERLLKLSDYVLDNFSDVFRGVEKNQMRLYLTNVHDKPKSSELSELRRQGYEGNLTIYQIFAFLHGKNAKNMSSDELSLFHPTRNSLNKIENKLREVFFNNHHIENHIKELMIHLELLIDLTDTGINRHAEISSVHREKYNTVLWIENKMIFKVDLFKLNQYIEISMHLEDHADKILKDDFNKRCRMIFE